MRLDDAHRKAREAIANTFVVTDTASFDDEVSEQEGELKLREPGAPEPLPTSPALEAGVYYVTMSFDSVTGDGTFRATVRCTDEAVEVVDYEAISEHEL